MKRKAIMLEEGGFRLISRGKKCKVSGFRDPGMDAMILYMKKYSRRESRRSGLLSFNPNNEVI